MARCFAPLFRVLTTWQIARTGNHWTGLNPSGAILKSCMSPKSDVVMLCYGAERRKVCTERYMGIGRGRVSDSPSSRFIVMNPNPA